jgi:nicotinate phosphoribosyltransferase
MDQPEIEPRTGKPKHFEQVAFERWLDANPNGTTLLLDTIDVYMGAVHAAMAATSTEARRRAFKGFRVDSGNLAQLGQWCLRFFAANGLTGLRPNLTGDLDVERLKQIVKEFPEVAGFGIGTKLSSEVRAVAGVIFKMCLIEDQPTLKASNSEEKITLPGKLQLFRGSDAEGNYVGDVIGLDSEDVHIPGAEEQRKRFRDIDNYPRQLSDRLRLLRDDLVRRFKEDHSGWESILKESEVIYERA